jgi:dTDP-4-amino-4,6-dideoxygalactose transaminase
MPPGAWLDTATWVIQMIDIPIWPEFEDDEIEAVARLLRSGRVNSWTGGDVTAFEGAWEQASGCVSAFAMQNGTLALEAAMRSLSLSEESEVLVPARAYVGCASAVVMAGLKPVFADVDATTGCVTAETLEAARTTRTAAAIVVHVGGWPADIVPICQWARSHGLAVIEDAAQAHGATVLNRNRQPQWVGTFGDFGCWSFCQDKILSTGGEGGMLAVADSELADRVWSIRDHGKSRKRVESHAPNNRFAWWVDSIGSNLRMTGMQAVIGLVQLQKLDRWLQLRSRNAKVLSSVLSTIEWIEFPEVDQSRCPAWYRVYASVRREAGDAGRYRDRVLDAAAEAGLPVGVGCCPEVYLEDGLQAWAPDNRLIGACDLGERSLCFPCHHLITEETMALYAEQMAEVCRVIGS